MLRKLKNKRLHIVFIVFICVLSITVYGCSPQDKKTTDSETDVEQETDSTTQPEVVQPVNVTEKGPETKLMIDPANAIAIIETERGIIEFEFYATDAPNASKNFIKNATKGYYRNEPFHDATELIVQAGSSFGADNIPIEKSTKPLEKGAVLMVAVDDGTMVDGDEFLICRDTIVLDGDQTIIGKVTKGLDVLDSIEKSDKILNITIRERNSE